MFSKGITSVWSGQWGCSTWAPREPMVLSPPCLNTPCLNTPPPRRRESSSSRLTTPDCSDDEDGGETACACHPEGVPSRNGPCQTVGLEHL